jgi:hypothetical protein
MQRSPLQPQSRRRSARDGTTDRIFRMGFKLGLILVSLVCLATMVRAEEKTVSILVVSQGGYRPVYVDYLYGIRPILTTNLSKRVVIYQENPDFTRFGGNSYREGLTGWLQNKYQNCKLDVIVASGQRSIDFVMKVRPLVWPQIPVVAIGSAEMITNSFEGQTNVTGFIVDNDVRGTLAAAARLSPDTRQIAFISPGNAGENVSSEFYRRDLQQAEDFCSNRFQLIKLVGLTMAETKQRLAQLPSHTIAYYDDIRMDATGPIFLPWAAVE